MKRAAALAVGALTGALALSGCGAFHHHHVVVVHQPAAPAPVVVHHHAPVVVHTHITVVHPRPTCRKVINRRCVQY